MENLGQDNERIKKTAKLIARLFLDQLFQNKQGLTKNKQNTSFQGTEEKPLCKINNTY